MVSAISRPYSFAKSSKTASLAFTPFVPEDPFGNLSQGPEGMGAVVLEGSYSGHIFFDLLFRSEPGVPDDLNAVVVGVEVWAPHTGCPD